MSLSCLLYLILSSIANIKNRKPLSMQANIQFTTGIYSRQPLILPFRHKAICGIVLSIHYQLLLEKSEVQNLKRGLPDIRIPISMTQTLNRSAARQADIAPIERLTSRHTRPLVLFPLSTAEVKHHESIEDLPTTETCPFIIALYQR